MYDNYSHADITLIYIAESVPGPPEDSCEYTKLIENYNSQLTESCNCVKFCTQSSCSCNNKSGHRNYVQRANDGKTVLNITKRKGTSITPIIECNDLCTCSENCGNRIVQSGPAKGLYVKTCDNINKGLGLFTENVVCPGTFICEYAGEIITKVEATARHEHNISHGKMNYIFCLNEHNSTGCIFQTFVDPSYLGNIGRYANHSCDPNCAMIPVRVNTPIPKLAIFSCKDIMPHTEITFQYGLHNSLVSSISPDDRKRCLCNSPKCMEFMPNESY